ncbi:MAG: hypothetical protein Q8Q33_02135 [Chlamydiota bacterium]|nr:hypothetical protein [Chlamydiota bacterium]
MATLCFRCQHCHRIITLSKEGPCLYCGITITEAYLDKVAQIPVLQLTRPLERTNKDNEPWLLSYWVQRLWNNLWLRFGIISLLIIIGAHKAGYLFEEKIQDDIKWKRRNNMFDIIDFSLSTNNSQALIERILRKADFMEPMHKQNICVTAPSVPTNIIIEPTLNNTDYYADFLNVRIYNPLTKYVDFASLIETLFQESGICLPFRFSLSLVIQRIFKRAFFELLEFTLSRVPVKHIIFSDKTPSDDAD